MERSNPFWRISNVLYNEAPTCCLHGVKYSVISDNSIMFLFTYYSWPGVLENSDFSGILLCEHDMYIIEYKPKNV